MVREGHAELGCHLCRADDGGAYVYGTMPGPELSLEDFVEGERGSLGHGINRLIRQGHLIMEMLYAFVPRRCRKRRT